MSDAATVVVVRHVQPLVQTVFDAAEAAAIKPQPSLGVQLLRRGAGQQGDGFGFATAGLAVDSGYLAGAREADCLWGSRGSAEDAGFISAPIAFLGAGARVRRFLRGERLPEFPAATFLSCRESLADCL